MNSQEQIMFQEPPAFQDQVTTKEVIDLPDMAEMDEATTAMIAELKNGNAQSMIAFFDLYYNPLCFFAERLVRNRPAAEDIVEDSFMKLWKKHTDFESIQNIKAFLYITTRNACLNFLKQSQRDTASKKEMAYLAGEKEDYVLNTMIRTEVLQEIYKEIEKLPAQSRKVFKMSVLENMKNQEIASALDVSIHTVKNQKMRAMQILRMSLLRKKS